MSSNKVVLTPLIGLMSGRPLEEVERYTVEQISKHHRLRDEASMLDAKLSDIGESDDRDGIEHQYVTSLIAMHAQQTVVSTLLDILGYIPNVPGPRAN